MLSDRVMIDPDKYYGRQATEYEAKRAHKPCWEREQQAVRDFVTHGPVLDVPCGTGRYIQIYKDKGLKFRGIDASCDMIAEAQKKHPDLVADVGSILELPFGNKEFGTVVCSRLLNWLYPEDMARAMTEIRRVGKTIVTSIRTGEKGLHQHQGNFTHSLEDFYLAAQGLLIDGRRHILSASDGEFEMFRLRKPNWNDVRRQFAYHGDKTNAIERLTSNWTAAYRLAQVRAANGVVKAEFWTHDRINDLVEKMAATPRPDGTKNAMITQEKPRHTDHPITVLRTQGHEAMLDGRRRSNVWRHVPGMYQALVIEVEP